MIVRACSSPWRRRSANVLESLSRLSHSSAIPQSWNPVSLPGACTHSLSLLTCIYATPVARPSPLLWIVCQGRFISRNFQQVTATRRSLAFLSPVSRLRLRRCVGATRAQLTRDNQGSGFFRLYHHSM